MSWIRWPWKKKRSRLHVEIAYDPDSGMDCVCHWPTGQADEVKAKIAEDFSLLMLLLAKGRLLSVVQGAVVLAGERSGEMDVAKSILFKANELLEVFNKEKNVDSGPLVPPSECFRVRRQREEMEE